MLAKNRFRVLGRQKSRELNLNLIGKAINKITSKRVIDEVFAIRVFDDLARSRLTISLPKLVPSR